MRLSIKCICRLNNKPLTRHTDADSWWQGVRIRNGRGPMKWKRTVANIVGMAGLFVAFMFPVAPMVFSHTGENIIGRITSWLGLYRYSEPGDELVDAFLLLSLLLAISVVWLTNLFINFRNRKQENVRHLCKNRWHHHKERWRFKEIDKDPCQHCGCGRTIFYVHCPGWSHGVFRNRGVPRRSSKVVARDIS